mmetsp:Transcript_16111/g.43925  ORF Transcript_16111/g.43925 Transcript_16111/m.43925 type:complete len:659 (+) Transcript_16111:144-2120(+)
MGHLRWALLASLLLVQSRGDSADDSVQGPVVVQQHHPQEAQQRPPPSTGGSEDVGHQFGELLEAALKSEFGNGTQRLTNGTYSTFLNSTNHENEEGKMETVLRISAKRDAEHLNEGSSGDYGHQGNGGQHRGHRQGGDGKGGPQRLDINPGEGKANREASLETTHEGDVDRIVTHDNAVFVLSKPSESLASLTIDSQLLSDITCLITASAVFGALAEAVHMPTMNGVLVAGAVAGPGGLQLVQELVQVETLAQLGALLLLFGLGMELSLAKLRSVWNVAVLGGALQIIISMALGMFMASSMFDAPPQTGAFVGGLLSMSSTSIVVKCLESLRSTGTMFGQITVGTLITQDVFVGIFFAVGPLFAKSSIQEPGSEDAAEQKGIAVLLVIKVFMKLGSTILMCSLFSTTVLRPLLRILRRSASPDLVQLLLVGFCFSMAWLMECWGLSSELGAILAGVCISIAAAGHGSSMGGMDVHHLHDSITSLTSIMASLFLSSIGLLLSPRFLWQHIHVLGAGMVLLVVVKSTLIALVVRAYGPSWRTAWAVGMTMGHVGEFAFILLSMAAQLKIVTSQVYALLLGITSLSLLTAPLLIFVTHVLLLSCSSQQQQHQQQHQQHAPALSPKGVRASVGDNCLVATEHADGHILLESGAPTHTGNEQA